MTNQNIPVNMPPDDEIDLAELWGRLLDYRKFIIVVTLVVLALGVAYAATATRIYRANSLLQIEPKQGVIPSIGKLSGLMSDSSALTQTQIQLLESRLVLGNAVDQLHMTVNVRPQQSWLGKQLWLAEQGSNPILFAGWRGEKAAVNLAKFDLPTSLQEQKLQLTATGNKRFTLSSDGEVLLKGKVEETYNTQSGITLRVADIAAPKGFTFTISQTSRTALIQQLKQHLAVSQQGSDTGILRLTYTDPSPAKAVAILKAIGQSYLMQNIHRSAAQASQSLAFVQKQLPEIKKKLHKAEAKLNAYRQKSDSVDVQLKTKSLLKRLVSVESQINEMKLKESKVASLYTKNHPIYQSLLQQMQSLQHDKARLEKQINQLPDTQQEVLRRTRDVKTTQQIYLQLLNKSQELKIAKASTVGNVRIVDTAVASVSPIKPKVPLIIAVSLLLGLMLSVGYVFLRLALRHGLETPEELEAMGLPVYAALPLSESQRKANALWERKKRRKQRSRRFLLARSDPGDIVIEALRSLRTSLHFAMMEGNNRLMITGASPGVGKSFVAANLAAVLATAGQKVLLIDADMRRGHLHSFFESINQEPGFSEYLSGQVGKQDVIQPTKVDALDFISRGRVPPNPSELLMQPALNQLLDSSAEEYDLIIIDTPPILAVTDAAVIGQQMGVNLMVARYDHNTAKEIETAMQRFEKSQVNIKGSIFNCIERQANNYYHYDYSYRSDKT